jgi:prenyltransferase/squalene oxidase-like repeat protein
MKRAAILLVLAGCAAPATAVYERPLDRAVRDGVAFLVSTQNPDGSWGTGRDTSDFDVLAMVPGSHDAFRVGTTGLCVLALREAGEKTASKRGLVYLADYDGLRRANRMEIYNVWGHTYALQALSRAWAEDRVEAWRAAAERHLRALERFETFVGGWNYYDFVAGVQPVSMEPTSFGTAAALVALHEAKQAGIAVPEGLVRRALNRVREMRKPDGSFLYGSDFRYHPMHLANRDKGSLGRTQSGHAALAVWSEEGLGEKEIREGLERLFAEHHFIEIGRKRQYPHEAWYFTAPYYYYFGHYYAALLIERLADKADYREQLRGFILPHQEPDGSWWDYRMWDYHKPYGTAFSVMTLLRCR